MRPTLDKPSRRVLGYIAGSEGAFGKSPFYQVRLDKSAAAALAELVARGDAAGRATLTLTASFHQPDRIRITEIGPPDFEARANATYVRGDSLRVQGREGVSCSIDLSAKWGAPALRRELESAAETAAHFVLLRVPSRKRNVVEFIPDHELNRRAAAAASAKSSADTDPDAIAAASLALSGQVLEAEDFSDWKR